jgi:hypothetical protein
VLVGSDGTLLVRRPYPELALEVGVPQLCAFAALDAATCSAVRAEVAEVLESVTSPLATYPTLLARLARAADGSLLPQGPHHLEVRGPPQVVAPVKGEGGGGMQPPAQCAVTTRCASVPHESLPPPQPCSLRVPALHPAAASTVVAWFGLEGHVVHVVRRVNALRVYPCCLPCGSLHTAQCSGMFPT